MSLNWQVGMRNSWNCKNFILVYIYTSLRKMKEVEVSFYIFHTITMD